MNLRSALLVGPLALALAAAALTVPAGPAAAQKRGGILTFIVESDPPTYDAHRETTFAAIHTLAPLYSVLVRVDPDDPASNRIVGDLAERWDVSPDGKTYTFHLLQGVKFTDGTPLTARDVVATYKKLIFPPKDIVSVRKGYYSMVDSVAGAGDATVTFRLKFATSAFLPALGLPYNYIFSADKLAQNMRWYEKNILGSGPFVFKRHTLGNEFAGARNDAFYRRGRPYLDGFEAKFTTQEHVAMQAIRGGRALAEFRGFSPSSRDDIVRAMGTKVVVQESPWNCTLFVIPNSHKKPFDDVRVRRALSLALNRWEGSEHVSKTAILKTVGAFIFPAHPLARSREELERLPGFGRDIQAARAEARRLLREAGLPEGYKTTFNNRHIEQPYKILAIWLIDQWRQVGLDVKQEPRPTDAYYAVLRAPKPEYDLSMDFLCPSVVNPTLDVSKIISTDRSSLNFGRYTDRKLDELYEAQLHEVDFEKQRALLHRMEERALEQGWVVPTLWWHRSIVHSAAMKGWKISPSHYLNQSLEQVWLDR